MNLRESKNGLRESMSTNKMVKVKTARKISNNPEATLSPIRQTSKK